MQADLADGAVTEISQTGPRDLRLSLSPTPEAVRCAHVGISAWMERIGLDAVLRSNTEIVIGEALNNVVEHAFAACPLTDTDAIRLELRKDHTGLRICIRDRGNEMPGLVLPEGQLPTLSDQTELLPEGGFGWFLIRELASGLDYCRQNGWNRLDMVMKDGILPPEPAEGFIAPR